ncbi:MAG TPA: PilZ domain-containing protein [Polyangiaceae bacterium]|nr:PilZ domain-containing protein [Polyangiaceae bacterium]
MKNRRSLTPIYGVPIAAGTSPTRRNDIRREVSERIQLRQPKDGPNDTNETSGVTRDRVLDGWALNVSRGGIRCILEESVDLGEEFEVTVGEEGNAPLTRRGRIVWLQEEADGFIVGVEFLTPSGTSPTAAAVPEGEDVAKAPSEA